MASRQLIVITGLAALIFLADNGTVSAQQACARPSTSNVRDTILITTTDAPPCRVAASQTGISLRSSTSGAYPDPSWTSVVRDSRGRFFTAGGGTGNRIISWNPDGSFLESFGRTGQGPGELGSTPILYVGRGDTLFAAHTGGRMSAFGPNAAFARQFTTPGLVAGRNFAFATDDGRFVSGGVPRTGNATNVLHRTGSDGALQQSFGATLVRPAGGRPAEHPVAYGGGTSFWTVRASPAGSGYQLEQWTIDGALRRVIRRSAPWLMSEEADAAVVPGGFPYVRSLWLDPDGLLWITMLVRDPKIGVIDPRQISDTSMSAVFDVRHEVVDPASGTVLASEVWDQFVDEDPNFPPIILTIPRSRYSYRQASDTATGLGRIDIFELRLVRR